MQRAPRGVQSVDVLNEVQLADAGPVLEVAPERAAERPERRPVPIGRRPGHVRQLDARLDPQDATVGRLEVRAPGLNPPRRPVARAVALRGDAQVAAAVEADVGRVVSGLLDLAGAPVGRSARVAVAQVELPVGAGRRGVRRAVEVVGEHLRPAGRQRRDRRVGCRNGNDRRQRRHEGDERGGHAAATGAPTATRRRKRSGDHGGSDLF